MAKKLIFAMIFFVLATALSVNALAKMKGSKSGPETEGADLVLYYGNGCPHCEIVENYIKEKNLQDKLDIAEKEVWNNKANQEEMVARAKICKLDLNNLGVPMMWNNKESKCYVGDTPIINLLDQQVYNFNGQ